jgi:hypothetical protein
MFAEQKLSNKISDAFLGHFFSPNGEAGEKSQQEKHWK